MSFFSRTKSVPVFLFTLMLLTVISTTKTKAQYKITVSAGAFDRDGSVVSFMLPEEISSGVYTMQSESGVQTELQVDNQNRGWFVLDHLAAGSDRIYKLNLEEDSGIRDDDKGVRTRIDDNTLTFTSAENKVFSYYHRENELPSGLDVVYKRAGYIHPVFSPEGVQLTNHLDTTMHPHHYGIWSAWTKTGFQGGTPDFWNVQDHTGRVQHGDSVEVAWEGPVHGGFKAKNFYVDLTRTAPVIALNERWVVRVFNIPGEKEYQMFDIKVVQSANTGQPLQLPEYHYGGMALRGHANWDNPDNVDFLTSEGYDRGNGNETRARWTHMGGLVNGKRAGMAVLGHPGNYRAPQPVRIHPEIPYFVYAPPQLGKMTIEPGSPYVMRYRYVTYDGKPDPEKLNKLWNDYAYPPGVTVVKQ